MSLRNSPIGRRSGRQGAIIRVLVSVEGNGGKARYPSRIVDVSVWGLRLKSSVRLETGQKVEVSPPKGPMFAVSGKVVWVRKAEAGQEAELGLEFNRPVPIDYWRGPGSRAA